MFTFSRFRHFPPHRSTNNITDAVILRFFINIFLYLIIVSFYYFVAKRNLRPLRRGFYCDDHSIRYPLQKQTISTESLLIIITVMVLFTFTIAELVNKCGCWTRNVHGWIEKKNAHGIIIRLLFFIDCCLSMLLMNYLFTVLIKCLVGRLRPHFLAVCLPNTDLSTCVKRHQYIANYTCSDGESWNVINARMSFFSGHASLCFATAIFCTLYTHVQIPFTMPLGGGRRMIRIISPQINILFRITIQSLLLLTAIFVAVTRIIDHYHFISDIVVGAIVGSLFALIFSVFVAQLFSEGYKASVEETNPLIESRRNTEI